MSMAQVLRLKPAFSDEQAQALAGLFDEELATKSDIERLRVATTADLQRLEAKLTSDVDKLRLEVQRDLKSTEARLIAWVVGQGAATIGILFALLHFAGK